MYKGLGILQHLREKVLSGHKKNSKLTAEQRRMYASEKQMNFRKIAKLCATRSRHVLTADDLASPELQQELAEIGQFAEVAYSVLSPGYVFEHLDALSRADFPLEGYDALPGATLVLGFRGEVADLPGFVVYRPQTKQLVLAISGTATVRHALYDVHFRKRRHPIGQGCAVHAGFWKLYGGIKRKVREGIERGMKEFEVDGLVLTGHSMGGAMVYLFALDLLGSDSSELLGDTSITVAAFGAPRVGNPALVEAWQDAVRKRREKKGEQAVREYSMKAFNDGKELCQFLGNDVSRKLVQLTGVPALPPASFGYRHFAAVPMYFYHGTLFWVPESEKEHGIFDVSEDALIVDTSLKHPRGGHNYYNSRDLERLSRRMGWVQEMMAGGTEWESKYLTRVATFEGKRSS
ncbi:uncharacterized protein PHACADRAFT_247336 [Phanerochaete carnosa HHB-10118-sp]|uniref:Fungal lipase-type domain-containing protein n=1 Tax=Phanerochaete carnosa (strain HHB-10118-sp) TaxID=650164 RepID=K5XDC5_PHACS|nr:uncharacterized protein PHACADRAFT_247336 [Phanerochaete carnosa HHB-10118-sp]EKM61027.1 hypothetical protein PHACADRAFT_247336 [Phanerochaete carnosa HHB-10118-sp]